MVMAHTYGAPMFTQFQLPELILENLAALKVRTLHCGKKNDHLVVPVLGRYVGDTNVDPIFLATSPNESDPTQPVYNPTPLFQQGLGQLPINLIDGSYAGGYVDLNGQYYQSKLQDWNAFVSASLAVSSTIKTLGSDQGALGLVALTMTRIVNPNTTNSLTTPKIDVTKLNVDPKFLQKKDSKKKVSPPPIVKPPTVALRVKNYQKSVQYEYGVLPPATSSELVQGSLLSVTPLPSEYLSLVQNLILPSIRFDVEGSQVLNMPKYQTEYQEWVSLQYNSTGTIAGSGIGPSSILQCWSVLAGWCIKGAGGEMSEAARVFQLLSDKGHAGMLSSILGGLVKTILPPEAHGMVDTIAEVLPI